MRIHRTTWGLLLILLALVVAGCDAPLEAKSKRAESASTPTPTATDSESAAEEDPSATPSAQTVPSVKVPKISVPPRPTGPVLGADISWPQCPRGMGIPQKQGQGSPMPLDAARYVILGLTNGPGFYANPCLASQVAWVNVER